MNSLVHGAERPCLYMITDRHACAGRDLCDVVAAALSGVPPGTVLVQLREKDLPGRALVQVARRLVAVAAPHGAKILVNDRVDVALAAGAHGVHLPERGMSIATVRALAGPGFLVGLSSHSPEAAAEAAAQGADLIVVGPVWATPSKEGYGAPLGPLALAAAAARVQARAAGSGTLLYALGGITGPAQAARACAAGASGIAAIRAFCSAEDPALAARQMYDACFSCH